MTGICKHHCQKLVRLCALYSLIFFITYLFTGCYQREETGIEIRWKAKRATGISIPEQLTQSISDDSLNQLVTVRLANKQTPILGNSRRAGNEVIFEPIIPFTRGLRYVVWLKNKPLSEVAIPTLDANDRPKLVAIYPSQDSLPDNLLKIYLQFSRPMREGQSQQYVTLLKNGTDTLPGVFLNLQPELWNTDRTLLTLWLDPGRIKRDLQPNQQLGAPLQAGGHYQLTISPQWPDEQGATLGKSTSKTFVTIQRDSLSPNLKHWLIREPKSGTLQPLGVSFGESLDYSLLTETLRIIQEGGKIVPGTWQIGDKEKQIRFTPTTGWQSGRYTLRIESRLEDVAGNNLNRPFDRDITRRDQPVRSGAFTKLFFTVR